MIRSVALLLTLLTGFSALVYEISWQKYLAILLGSHSEATAAVLGIFLGGLAIGYALFGYVSNRLVARAREREESPRSLIQGITELYADSPKGVNASNALARATAATEVFKAYFHYAAPFSHQMIEALWQRSQSDPECSEARAEAEAVLGEKG